MKTQLSIPILVVSEANQREHWRARHNRKKSQQAHVTYCLLTAKPSLPDFPLRVQLTRYGTGVLDPDNLAGAFKHVIDSLAKFYQVDDGDPRWVWLPPKQVRSKRKDAAVLIELESIAAETTQKAEIL